MTTFDEYAASIKAKVATDLWGVISLYREEGLPDGRVLVAAIELGGEPPPHLWDFVREQLDLEWSKQKSMTDRINLADLRQACYGNWGDPGVSPGDVLALIDAVEAANELADAADSIAVYPEGPVGFENLGDALQEAHDALRRFDFTKAQA